MTTAVVVRHGQTDWNSEGRMQGWAPVPLNERGREQAVAAGEYLAGEYDVDRAVCSDLLRTRETAARLCDPLGLDPAGERVEYTRAWRERDLGVYQGLTYADIYERFPEFGLGEAAVRAASETPEGGESLLALRERVLTGWADLLDAADGDETVLVVTHGGPIHLLLGHVKALDVREAFLEHSMANCGITVLEHPPEASVADTAEAVAVVDENVTEWAG
ncbi:histidine phosphatase family protein [Haloglomus litoreum]|uniref:histidine phosphatase family protein n=1 Tax=Haloglomus litoreum TaxID=3034026 RepID=UPI0023E7ABEB|nr:histidine phosphatase family protein [Haloglomus sp. DT116]